MGSRKRPRQHQDEPLNNAPKENDSNKKQKKNHKPQDSPPKAVQHAVLTQYYSQIHTLREWVLSKPPKTSKIRRKKLANLGLDASAAGKTAWSEDELAVGALLDTTLVAVRQPQDPQNQEDSEEPDQRWQKWVAFSHGCGGDESYVTLSSGNQRDSAELQSDMVDYVIWLLFSREVQAWPKHMLCDGFRKAPTSRLARNPNHQRPGTGTASGPGKPMAGPSIPGIYQVHHNYCVKALKEPPWPQLLTLLGQSGQRMMLELLLDCSVFVAVKAGRGNYNQLTGMQMSEMDPLAVVADQKGTPGSTPRQPSEITFMRSRMMYARAALNARGNVHFGLRHIHVLNRFPRRPKAAKDDDKKDHDTSKSQLDESVVHIMMYMFPRQFGLHNVFTSIVDRQQTAQKFQDYTLREEEIAKKFPKTPEGRAVRHIPKRLRGKLPLLIEKLQTLHERCSYSQLLQYYCPVGGQSKDMPSSEARSTTTQRGHDSVQEEGEDEHGSHSQGLQPTQNRSLLLPSRPQSKPNRRKRQSLAAPAPVELPYDSLVDLSTPISSVSAFCQAVLSKLIPNEFWGPAGSATQEHNKSLFLKRVHEFIHLRRFETTCLHQLVQGMKITEIEWLAPPPPTLNKTNPPQTQRQKCSQSDTQKRREIFHEFLYYLFDSILIPLIRSNFYVTESSGSHRYRVFFFRHDIWRQIAEPAMAALKTDMFEEVPILQAKQILGSRKLGFSAVRLLPKGKGGSVRMITNLRRRSTTVTTILPPAQAGQEQRKRKIVKLGPSINSVLGPASEVLKLKLRKLNPELLGAGMFSIGDIYTRIKRFKTHLSGKSEGGKLPKLYFAKVDVQAAFDTIPQEAIIQLLQQNILRREEEGGGLGNKYKIVKHAEVQPLESTTTPSGTGGKSRSYKRWHSTAQQIDDFTPFAERIAGYAQVRNKKDTVFVGSALERVLGGREVVNLVGEHIQRNLVKVGKKFYRQKKGIPQGSVLSSLLCNYFYGELEKQELGFLRDGEDQETGQGKGKGGGKEKGTLLMRLIDDFLLVTTDKGKAERFVRRMYEGFEEYGVRIRLEKSLVNFEMSIDGVGVPMVRPEPVEGNGNGSRRVLFPYCRVLIDCQTLDVGKQRDEGLLGLGDPVIFNSLTVEYSRCPGQNFKRKVLNAFKIQSHLMFFDTSHNSPQAVFTNIYTTFLETATKMWAYARCLPQANKPSIKVVQDTLKSLVDVAYLLLNSWSRKTRYPGYVCVVGKRQVAWLAMRAFGEVLGRKQAGYRAVVDWIRGEVLKLEVEGLGLDVGKTDGRQRTKMEQRQSGGNELAVLRRVVNETGRGKYRGGL